MRSVIIISFVCCPPPICRQHDHTLWLSLSLPRGFLFLLASLAIRGTSTDPVASLASVQLFCLSSTLAWVIIGSPRLAPTSSGADNDNVAVAVFAPERRRRGESSSDARERILRERRTAKIPKAVSAARSRRETKPMQVCYIRPSCRSDGNT